MRFPYLKLTSLALATAVLLNTQAVLAENVIVKETKDKNKQTTVQGGGDAGGGNAAVKAVSTKRLTSDDEQWIKYLVLDSAKLVPYVLRFQNIRPQVPVIEVQKLTIKFEDKCFGIDETEDKKEVTSSAAPGGPICFSIKSLIADPKINQGNVGSAVTALLAHEAGHVAGLVGHEAELDLKKMQQQIVENLRPNMSFFEADQIRKSRTLELQLLMVKLDKLNQELDEKDISMSTVVLVELTSELIRFAESFEEITFQYRISPISFDGLRALNTACAIIKSGEGFVVSPKKRKEHWSLGNNFLRYLSAQPVGTNVRMEAYFGNGVYADAEVTHVGYQDFESAKRVAANAKVYLEMALSDLYVSDSLGLRK